MTITIINKGFCQNYANSLSEMQNYVNNVANNISPESIWLTEYDDVYTMGSSAKDEDLLSKNINVYTTNRGGQVTYHGPGQRVVYPIINLKKRMQSFDVRAYVKLLENWIINVLNEYGIKGEVHDGRVGVWVKTPGRNHPFCEAKVAAIGIRITKGIAYHGFAVNINPNLAKFSNIVPCGLANYGVTSLNDLGADISMEDFDKALLKHTPGLLK